MADFKIIDRRSKALGGQHHDRSLGDITTIVWHYTATNTSFIDSHERYWRDVRGWDRGGYHFYIDRDGNIYHNYDYTRMTWGVANSNDFCVHVSVEAKSGKDYTAKQIEARDFITRKMMIDLGISARNVKGHWEVYNNTNCPGYSRAQMDAFRADLAGGSAVSLSPAETATNGIDKLAQRVIDGEYGTGDARKRALGNLYTQVQARVNELLAEGAKPSVGKSIDQLAKETIDGKYGVGAEREQRLGNQYEAVQARVNQILGGSSGSNKSVDLLARETINGYHGQGQARKDNLGSMYNAVQARVNEILAGNSKSIDAVAREVLDGKWGNGADRKNRLTKAGYNFNEVQNRVNQLV